MSIARLATAAGLGALLAALPALAPPARAANFFAPDARVEVQWEAGQSRGGPIVSGRVLNHTDASLTDVRVRVESLDAAGRVIGETVTRLPGELSPRDRYYFEVRVRVPGASYRVQVVSFTFIRS